MRFIGITPLFIAAVALCQVRHSSAVTLRAAVGKPEPEILENRKLDTRKPVPDLRSWPKTRLLVYVAAQYDDNIAELLQANVKHLRNTGISFDLLLGHYDQKKKKWLKKDKSWYDKEVRWGVDLEGFKVHLLADVVQKKRAEGMQFEDYDWVWMLDEDIDITRMNPSLFFGDMESSSAMIVAPAFLQVKPETTVAVKAKNPDRIDEKLLEDPYYPMNTPQWDHKVRYVPLVEIIMPMVRPQALKAFFDCPDCLAPYNSDWGIDHIWCAYTAKSVQVDETKVCAVVDHSGPIYHLNYGSTRTKAKSGDIKSEGNKADDWAKKYHGEEYRTSHAHKSADFDGYDSKLFNFR